MTATWPEVGLDVYRDAHGDVRRGCYLAMYQGKLYARIVMRGHGSRGVDYVIHDAAFQPLWDTDHRTLKVRPSKSDNPKTVIREKVAELINQGRLKSEAELTAIKAGIETRLEEERVLRTQRKQQVIDRLNVELSRIDGWGHEAPYRLFKATAKLLLEHETVELMDLWPHVLAMGLEGTKE